RLMLNCCELVGVDVKGDARTRVAHLPRDGDDVSALANEVRAIGVAQIVEGKPWLPVTVEPSSVGCLRKATLREVPVVESGPLAGREDVGLLVGLPTLKRNAAMLTQQDGKFRQEHNVPP